jgi:predicted CopG family antitoxin
MVKVITIKDNVYEELKALKEQKNMSFSEVIAYLLRIEREKQGKRVQLLNLKGVLTQDTVTKKLWRKFGRRQW